MKYKPNHIFAGRYRLTQHLGTGGFAEVWKAEDMMADNSTIAVKIFAPDKGLDADGITVFRREYALTLPLRHNHLLTAYHFDVNEGSPYLIMPFCAEGSLMRKIVHHHAFSEVEIAGIMAQLVDGLAYLHENRITHQDMKPDNVLLLKNGYYVLADFGISSHIRRTVAKTIQGEHHKEPITFTPAYAPPEKYSGKPGPAGDIFSLGVSLYECLTGDIPFSDVGTALERGATIPSLSKKYSRGLDDLLMECMAVKPEDRPTAKTLYWAAKSFLSEGYWSLSDEFLQSGETKFPEKPQGQTISIGSTIEEKQFSGKPSISKVTRKLTVVPSIDIEKEIIGREETLVKLLETVQNSKKPVVINGIGGIGKTTIARAFVQKYAGNYTHVAWIERADDFSPAFVLNKDLHDNLGLKFTNNESDTEVIRKLMLGFRNLEGNNLLVLNNADLQLKSIADLLPIPPEWHVLITSREKIGGFQEFRLNELDIQQSLDLFLLHYSGDADQADLEELLKYVGYHTLTIELLAKTLENSFGMQTVTDLLDHLKNRKLNNDEVQRLVEVSHSKGETELYEHLIKTFDLVELNDNEIALLKQFVLLPPAPIPFPDLLKVLDIPKRGQKKLSNTITALNKKGRVEFLPRLKAFKVHRLVREILFYQLNPVLEDAIPIIGSIAELLSIDHNKDNPVDKFKWMPYGEALIDLFQDPSCRELSRLKEHFATVLYLSGNYKRAAELMEEAMHSAISNFGINHPIAAKRQSVLGIIYSHLGQYEKAMILHKTALESSLRNFGKDHPLVVERQAHLATGYKRLGKFEKAMTLFETVLEWDLKNLGKGHHAFAIHQSNLALVYKELGRYEKAATLLEEALETDLVNFGRDHPSLAVKQSNLSFMYKKLGQYEKAMTLAKTSLESRLKNFGEGHPDVAISQSNLALVYIELGQNEIALNLLKKVLEWDLKNFGKGHPYVAISQNYLALVFRNLKQYDKAVNLLETALDTFLLNYEENHQRVAKAQLDLGSVYLEMGQFEKANTLINKGYNSLLKKLGPKHPDTQKAKELLDDN